MTASKYIKKCPIGCDSILKPAAIALKEGMLLRCEECGQLMSQCTEAAYFNSLAGFNTPEGTLPDGQFDDSISKFHKKRLKKISDLTGFAPNETRLLDVGCSSGAFLAAAKKTGFIETGIEPAAEPVKTARKHGLNVLQGFLHDLKFPDDYYDVITLFEVIEHLKDPLDLLKECRRVLKTGGLMVIGTGNTSSWTVDFMENEWDYFDLNLGGHISFFNPLSLRKIAERCGFSIVKLETRSVSLYRKDQVSRFKYTISKTIREILSPPAKLLNKGHDILLFMRKKP